MKNQSTPRNVHHKRNPLRHTIQLALGALVMGTLLHSAFAADDWVTIYDPKDMADTSGDIHSISARVKGDSLYLSMTVELMAAPPVDKTPTGMVNRYYYHWLLDTDNNPATGRSNAEYEGSPTGVTNPIGAEVVVQLSWRDGAPEPDGVYVYDALNEDVVIITNFLFQVGGNTLTAVLPLEELGLTEGQTIAFSAFQEGASDDWAVDWMESATLTLSGLPFTSALVYDPKDMADTSGDIHAITAHVEGEDLLLSMTVELMAAPPVDKTPTGMVNRYYYHWLLDTDNNPATGRSNSEYEGSPTGVTNPIGAEVVVQIAWRDGAPEPDGVYIYDALNEDVVIVTNFLFHASGNTLSARIPMADLGLVAGQTIALSAFQEGASDDWAVDWMESATLTLTGPGLTQATVCDPKDMADTSGDIHAISAHVESQNLILSMTVELMAAPPVDKTPIGMVNRYYYHWLLDTDNNPATGRSNSEYEGSPTGVTNPIGAEVVVQIAWRDGAPEPDGVYVYDALNEDVVIITNFTFQASGNTLTAVLPLEELGLVTGQTIAVSAFQEGASDDWAVDWMESSALTLTPPSAGRMKIDGDFSDWADADAAGVVTSVSDPSDMLDSSGDIKQIQATVEGGYLYLRMSVYGIALPSVEETPVGMVNRYYYHWLLDTDNNPATGRSNSEYEGSPTGVANPIGAEVVAQIAWRDGAAEPDGVYVYDALNEDNVIVTNYDFSHSGDSVEARVKLSDLDLALGQTIAISAFQEGASDDWAVDWMESAAMTLTEAGSTGMALVDHFDGDAYGYKITVEDGVDLVVDTASVVVRVDGELAQPTVTKAGGVTTIVGVYPALLEADSLHKVALSLLASSEPQAKDYVYRVEAYTVLPLEGSFQQVNENNKGFSVHVSKISEWQTFGVYSVHSNIVEYAEMQLAGLLTDPYSGAPYYNELTNVYDHWVLPEVTLTGVVNWYELAPGEDASLNFPNDQPFPYIDPAYIPFHGVAIDIVTYLQLQKGEHKLGLYTEGGYAAYSGLTNTGPVLGMYDNTVGLCPSYHALNKFFNVVAPEDGYYPIRLLYFQSDHNQEPGLMLEYFNVADRELHLLNDDSDPLSLRGFRAGPLTGGTGEVTTPVVFQPSGGNLIIQYTGMLQWATDPTGPWYDFADATQSPVTVPIMPGNMFFRSRSY